MKKFNLQFLLILFCFFNVSCQTSIDKYFKPINSSLLVDDVTVKYSKYKTLPYSSIKNQIKDSGGRILITIDDEKHHLFQAIGSKKINDTISYYLFSHRKTLKNNRFDYEAFLAVYNKTKLVDFRGIYSNTDTDTKFGAVFLNNKYALFQTDVDNYDYYKINSEGFVYEDKKNMKIENIHFDRNVPYKLKLNTKFYKEDKVLLKVDRVNEKKPYQSLREIAKKDLKRSSTFFISEERKDEYKVFIYLNLLKYIDDDSPNNTFEVIKDIYDDNVQLKYFSISDYYTMPNGKEVVEEYTLDNRIN